MDNNAWEKIHSQKIWGRYPNEELVRFIGRQFFQVPEEERNKIKILEVGCGQGANLWFLAREGFDSYGIDISPSAISKAKKYLEEEQEISSIKLSICDVRDLQFQDKSFDVVIDVAGIMCVSYEDHKKVYKKIYNILKPKGYFWSLHLAEGSWGYGNGNLIDYQTFNNISEGPSQNQGTICMLSDADIKTLLENAGFCVASTEKYSRTYENQKKEIVHWIVTAIKNA